MESLVKKITYKSKADTYYLIPLGDIHMGNAACDVKRFAKLCRWIATTKNVMWIGMGDLSDNIVISDSKRFDPETIDPMFRDRYQDLAMAQKEVLEKYLAPIADKCIGLLSGNHETEILKHHHIDLIKELCKSLGVENLGYEALIRLQFIHTSGGSSRNFTLHVSHGSGGGKRVGSKINRVEDSDLGYDADIFLCGHTHVKAFTYKERLYIPRSQDLKFDANGVARPEAKARRVCFGVTGCFLKKHVDQQEKKESYDRSPITYPERWGLNPSGLGTIKLEFSMKDGDCHARV